MNKKISIIVISVIVVLLLVVGFFVLNSSTSTGVNITIAPDDSRVFIDSKAAHIGINKTTPGKHTVEVKRGNFYSSTVDFTSIKNEVVELPIGLTPSNTEGEKVKNKNSDKYLELDGLISKQVENESSKIANEYPIVTDLPKDISPIFRIDYGISKRFPDDPTKIAIYISSDNPADKIAAIKYIYIMGYDPSDYEIIFEELKNDATNN